jgi:hypothetical protein
VSLDVLDVTVGSVDANSIRDRWKDVIRRAVVQGKKGWVTIEDRLEWLMEGQAQVEE